MKKHVNKQIAPIALPDPGEPNLGAIDPLDSRYFDKEIAKYISERSRISYQAHVEAVLAYTLAEFNICSESVAEQIDAATRRVVAEDVYAEEQITKHDIKALVNCIKSYLDDGAKPYVHFGATSYDIIATANALQMRAVISEVVVPRLRALIDVLADIASTYATTVQIGRTHGQHAVPITFGFAISEYISRLSGSTDALTSLCEELKGKFSGAVGAYNALSVFVDDPLAFEASLLGRLGLQPAPYATQIVPPEGMVRLIDELAITAGIMANLAHDMRHLQRSEINEVREKFEDGQTGSSTMAHKRNPWNFENVISMSKQVLAQVVNANLNLSSEHQRDLTDSASSRFYVLVPACIASMTARLQKIMSKIEVDQMMMEKNLSLSAGAIAAEPFYLLLEKYGHTNAHEVSKKVAHQALSQKIPLTEAIHADTEADTYWQKFTDIERRIVEKPAEHYTGLAATKTHMIVKNWRSRST